MIFTFIFCFAKFLLAWQGRETEDIQAKMKEFSPYRKIPISVWRGNEVNLKPLLNKHHGDSYQRQKTLKDAKISGQKFEKQDICMFLNYLP